MARPPRVFHVYIPIRGPDPEEVCSLRSVCALLSAAESLGKGSRLEKARPNMV